jgi:hypothetical protein
MFYLVECGLPVSYCEYIQLEPDNHYHPEGLTVYFRLATHWHKRSADYPTRSRAGSEPTNPLDLCSNLQKK